MDKLKILSIDVGIINLGFIYATIYFPEIEKTSKYNNLQNNNSYHLNKESIKKNIHVINCNRIDITKIKHSKIKACNCSLRHESCIPDYLDHFIQEHLDYFNECDILLIERQPPMGITNVQDLLFTRFRNKVKLISPNSVHKYFGFGHDYNIRKEQSEFIALDYLLHFNSFVSSIRKHDMSDALLMIIFYYYTTNRELIEKTDYNYDNDHFLNFEKFRFFTNN